MSATVQSPASPVSSTATTLHSVPFSHFSSTSKMQRTYFPFDTCACAVTLQARPLANARAHSRTQCTKLLSSSHLTSPCTFSIDRREQQCDEPINGRCQWQPFASPQVPSLDLPQRVWSGELGLPTFPGQCSLQDCQSTQLRPVGLRAVQADFTGWVGWVGWVFMLELLSAWSDRSSCSLIGWWLVQSILAGEASVRTDTETRDCIFFRLSTTATLSLVFFVLLASRAWVSHISKLLARKG